MARKMLFGIPARFHISLAMDDVAAMEARNYTCFTTAYGRNDSEENKIIKLIGTIKSAIRLLKEIRKTRPDYLYLNSRFEPVASVRDFITLLILKSFYRPPTKIIIKSHGSDSSILDSTSFFYKKLVVPFLTRHVDYWIFLSIEEKRNIEQRNPTMGSKVHVLPNIIVPERCQIKDSFAHTWQLPKNKFICLFAGRLTEIKGIFDIIDAVPHLSRPSDFHFVFVGDGPDAEKLRKKASDVGHLTSIQFTGYIADSECDQFYSAVDALIYPTRDTEGFCMAIFKSIACGLPVITTPVRAALDYLSDPENVFWVEGGNAQQIAAALEKLYENPALRKRMRLNNKTLAAEFSQAKVGKRLDEILDATPNQSIAV